MLHFNIKITIDLLSVDTENLVFILAEREGDIEER